jgi:hypothetical protein
VCPQKDTRFRQGLGRRIRTQTPGQVPKQDPPLPTLPGLFHILSSMSTRLDSSRPLLKADSALLNGRISSSSSCRTSIVMILPDCDRVVLCALADVEAMDRICLLEPPLPGIKSSGTPLSVLTLSAFRDTKSEAETYHWVSYSFPREAELGLKVAGSPRAGAAKISVPSLALPS